jgi:hypothetical protein
MTGVVPGAAYASVVALSLEQRDSRRMMQEAAKSMLAKRVVFPGVQDEFMRRF